MPLFLLAACLSAAPATPATPGGIAYDPTPPPGIHRQVERVRERIHDGRDGGQLSRREARALRREARQIGRLGRRYGHGGLSEGERRELEARLRYLEGAVATQRSQPQSAGPR